MAIKIKNSVKWWHQENNVFDRVETCINGSMEQVRLYGNIKATLIKNCYNIYYLTI